MQLPLLVDGGGMIFGGLGEVQTCIEEACNSCILLCEDLDDCWQTEDTWGGLMTESFNGGGTGITSDYNSLLFEWLSLRLENWLSRGVFCEDLDYCSPTENSWGGLVNKLFNGGETYINGDDNSLIIDWIYLLLEHRLLWGFLCCLPWLLPVPLLWKRPTPFRRGMMNALWVCGGVVCLLFCLLMDIEEWEQMFWSDKCSHVSVSVPVIKLVTIFLYQYHSN